MIRFDCASTENTIDLIKAQKYVLHPNNARTTDGEHYMYIYSYIYANCNDFFCCPFVFFSFRLFHYLIENEQQQKERKKKQI